MLVGWLESEVQSITSMHFVDKVNNTTGNSKHIIISMKLVIITITFQC